MAHDDDSRRPDDDPEPWWARLFVAVAALFGVNRTRANWKLRQWRNRWQTWRRRTEQQVQHVRYEHKTCPHCGAVQDRQADVCSRCKNKLGARRWQVMGRLGLRMPRVLSVSGLLGLSIAVIYVLTGRASGSLWTIDGATMIRFGGHVPELVAQGEYWRWATSTLLHAGMWHIGFNLIALAVVGPQLEQRYGRLFAMVAFLVTGVVASIGSGIAHPIMIGIGASGGLMGLIGVLAGEGHRDGTPAGIAIRNDMLKWAAYVMVFGFIIGADNVAHGVGFAAGAAIGFGVRPRWLHRARWLYWPLGVVAMAGWLATSLWIGVYLSRSEVTTALETPRQAPVAVLARACAVAEAGDTDRADRMLREFYREFADRFGEEYSEPIDTPADMAALRVATCESMGLLRDNCQKAQDTDYPTAFPDIAAYDGGDRIEAIRAQRRQCALLLDAYSDSGREYQENTGP